MKGWFDDYILTVPLFSNFLKGRGKGGVARDVKLSRSPATILSFRKDWPRMLPLPLLPLPPQRSHLLMKVLLLVFGRKTTIKRTWSI